MVDTDVSPSSRSSLPAWLQGRVGVIVALLGAMWLVEIVDTLALADRLQGNGIVPRSLGGLDGVLWAPFLHGGTGHVLSNTLPFAILSALVLARGVRHYIVASAIIVVVGGLLVWAFAIGGDENHIGASGWVFGLFGYLVGSAWFDRRPLAIVSALVAIALYGTTVLFGFLPRTGVSWEGHAFGLVAGVIAARVLSDAYARRDGRRRDDSHPDHRT